ncbi:MAG TPA: hypothetical protein VN285_02855 [Candidatus Deferrimicrobium sp.]|nr:hypothetical protein [Candidatus Deferrimicrobium sp.]
MIAIDKTVRLAATVATLLLGAFFCAPTVRAQGVTEKALERYRREWQQKDTICCKAFCFRGNRSPRCRAFMIFESGILFAAHSTRRDFDEGAVLNADLGVMVNLDSHQGLGGSVHLVYVGDDYRYGLGPRYRRWLWRQVAVDLSAYVLLGGRVQDSDIKVPGLATSVSLVLGDLISVDAYLENCRFTYTDQTYGPTGPVRAVKNLNKTSLYIGVTGRSYLTFFTPLVGVIM